ncbi:MBG domain-containing protein [uncultured Cohaesibacter sp.]|uniref:MBG domain-containing protein n=1 Tax=uncultured Cohaesibacter sp. TaxID=1002546 RepID=UPI002AAB61FD|nr:MBG domain-containing protein [uncultured Cohaesibacter sp.]
MANAKGMRSNQTGILRCLLLPFLLTTSSLTTIPALAGDSLPSGGAVTSGSALISTSGNAMTVTQGTNKAIVNWNSFSIGQGNSVTFVQPSSSSAILNRVTGNTPSSIAGSLNANGQVYLINPNGVAITSSGAVKVGGGFVASTLNIKDEDFLSGNLSFEGDGSSAPVSNDGVISIGRGGYAALMGGTVSNDGLIAVPLGTVGLGSGEQVTLDLSGDGFMQVALPTKDGAEGDRALIENSGTISANGGSVIMKAATAREAARQAVNMTGVVEAQTVSGSNGAIVIGGGAGGKVSVSGKVKATAKNSRGGNIKVTGAEIDLVGAEIVASGATGGGTILVGGKKHGADGVQTATTTSVDEGTKIRADATVEGDGGEVVIWSDALTTYAGTITARGAGTGSGGDAEVSGKQTLSYSGLTDLSAESGQYGTLLLDPYNITITDGGGAGASFTASADDSSLSVSTLITQLGLSDVEISTGSGGTQDGNITIASDVSWSADTTLTLTAANDIYINANISVGGTSAGLTLAYGNDYSIATGSSISFADSSASLVIGGNNYTLLDSMSALDDIDNVGLSGYYALAADLDASGTTYTDALVGLGGANRTFSGLFAGLGHTISNLTISDSATSRYYLGLFGHSSGSIRDIGLIDANISLTSSANNELNVGTLVGYQDGGSVINAYSTGSLSVSGATTVTAGGLIGVTYDSSSIISSHSLATVTATTSGSSELRAGGLIGYHVYHASIQNSYAKGDVTATHTGSAGVYAGGLVGYQSGSSITSSYATGSVGATGTNVSAGGLSGLEIGSNSSMSNSYATGDVTASGSNYVWAGGLIGRNSSGSLSHAYATGATTINAADYAYAGGLIGTASSAKINETYASGAVSASGTTTAAAGGLVGRLSSGSTTLSYFDIETTGQNYGAGTNHSATGITGLTTAEARYSSNYSGWDFDTVWYQTGDMRPILRAEAATGTGAATTISSLHQIALIATDLSGSYYLIDDIDATETDGSDSASVWGSNGWEVVGGAYATPFTGSLNGYDHTISGLTINDTSSSTGYYGMFGYSSGSIQNITIANATVDITSIYNVQTGLLVGSNTGTIQSVSSSGSITTATTSSYALVWSGGLVGYSSGVISNSDSSASVSVTSARSTAYAGGLVGFSRQSISDSYATGTVYASNTSGDLLYAGGLVAWANGGTISNSYATGDVTAYGHGDVDIGGLVGYSSGAVTIATSYATGDVYAESDLRTKAGGLVGNSDRATIINTYATGSVTSVADGASSSDASRSGGLVGFNKGTISYSYATGSISATTTNGTAHEGGLLGFNATAGTITSSYFDTTTSDQTYGVGNDTSASGVTGLVTADFQNTLTFMASASDWNYNTIWAPSISGYYPELYALSPVIRVDGSTTSSYGTSDASVAYDTTIYGSSVPNFYYLGTSNEIDFSDLISSSVVGTSAAGSSFYVSGSEVSVLGSDGNTYRVIYTGKLTVGLKALTITATDASKTYGDTTSFGYTSSGLVNSDSISSVSLSSSGASASADVGTGSYAITASNASGSGLSNYAITYQAGTLTVNPKALTVTATNVSKTYGNKTSLNYTATGLLSGDSLTGALASNGTATTANVGSYSITQGTLANSNYAITYQAGTLTVNPKALTVTATDVSKTYGDTASLGYSSSGLVNSDSISSVTLSSNGATSSADVGTGSYAITASNASGSGLSNYAITYQAGTLTVNPKALTVTATDISKTYGDTASLGYTSSGLVNSDSISSVSLTSNGATSSADVGTGSYAITASNASGSGLSNYAITYQAGTLTVNPKALTVTATDVSKTYGDKTSLNYTATGLLSGDSLTGALASNGTATTANVGSYSITQGTLANSNYAITYQAGTLTVNAKALTITATDASKTYGDTASLGYSSSGLVNSDSISSVSLTSSGATASADVGTGSYAITASNASGSGLSNYAITYQAGTLTVNPKALTVTATDISKTYGDTTSLSYTATGLLSGDSLTGALVSTGVDASANVGSYAITQGTLANGNYAISYLTGSLEVIPAELKISANDVSKELAENIALSYAVSGLLNHDSVTAATLFSEGLSDGATAGEYAILVSDAQGVGLTNYNIVYEEGTLTVPAHAPSAETAGLLFYLKENASSSKSGYGNGSRVLQSSQLAGMTGSASTQPGREPEGNEGTMLTEDAELVGAVCFAGTGNAVACSSN